MGSILTWFITSKWGITILLAVALAAGSLITYKLVVDRAFDRGVAKCRGELLAATALENQRQARLNVQRNTAASEIANAADAAGADVVRETDAATNDAKETIHVVYRDRPATKPVAPGSCVHPVDKRVQDKLSEAFNSANSL